MNVGTLLYTWLKGRQVGIDQFGNRYFEHKSPPVRGNRRKRWVLFEGMAEASKVPPEWHAWLHHMVDETPRDGDRPRHDWQQDHLPNLTGTAYAHRPQGHVLAGGKRAAATGDYEAWSP
ncbi:MAG: NADH:ubiquinone oxidoreductase subunit NDUFA12 [Rhodospirillaceae bacterium]|jgi:NADH:ubiquinone oxidoreductase subunit|nr:NADH:ubiquinone oxidoreductase subunit NDUFA12 [Rhodospirillaceae bacterium]MBT6137961.1 NADH:ubiquinone oxidoreductase subunit NDUFA12 [Rhodospirillaceae bacterium]